MQINTTKGNVPARKANLPGGGIIQVFLNVDMRNMHDGLTKIAKKNGIEVGILSARQYVVFINAAKTKVKVYAANDTIAYSRSKSGKLQMEAVAKIPECFGGGAFNYDQALKLVLEELLKRKKQK